MKSKFLAVNMLIALGISASAMATEYTFELATEPTWTASGSTTTTTSQTVQVRSYVPGSSTITYRNMTIYSSSTTAGSNEVGDTVGYDRYIYGVQARAWINSPNGKTWVNYPTNNLLYTYLTDINNDRIAVGYYAMIGAANHAFFYDLIYHKYIPFDLPVIGTSSFSKINNAGKVLGFYNGLNSGGYFTYDCQNGFQPFSFAAGATSYTIAEMDDAGNLYGTVTGIPDAAYFIAHPVGEDLSSCLLLPRDDVPPPIAFGNEMTIELGGDQALAVWVGDFDGGGVDDWLIGHGESVDLLYIGEDNFDTVIRVSDFRAVLDSATVATQWDFNNDGMYDQLRPGNASVLLTKPDGSLYYVPMAFPHYIDNHFGDFNGDGLIDVVSIDGAFATISFQLPADAATGGTTTSNSGTTTGSTTTTTGSTTTTTTTITTGDVPAISADAQQLDIEHTVVSVSGNSAELDSGETLWISADTVITYNDSTGIAAGQLIQAKVWDNQDGNLIAVTLELP